MPRKQRGGPMTPAISTPSPNLDLVSDGDTPSRGEFDMLARHVSYLAAGLDAARSTGAQLGVVQVQIGDLRGDVGAVATRLDLHEGEHRRAAELAAKDRISRARFRVTTFVAGVSALGGVYGLLLYLAAHLH